MSHGKIAKVKVRHKQLRQFWQIIAAVEKQITEIRNL